LSVPFAPFFVLFVFGIRTYSYLVRAIRTLLPRSSAGDGRAAGDTPKGGYALPSGALGVVLCALLYLLGLVCEYRREYPVSTAVSTP
jgi:hypothetical protein